MELNLLTVLLIIGLMAYMGITRIKMYIEHKNALDEINHRNDFQKIFTGKINLLIYVVVVILSIATMFYVSSQSLSNESFNTWMLVSLVLLVTSLTDILRTIVLHTTYYNDQGIFHNLNFFRYNSVKNFTVKRIGYSTEVNLFNGKSYPIPTKALQFLEDRIVVSKKNKK